MGENGVMSTLVDQLRISDRHPAWSLHLAVVAVQPIAQHPRHIVPVDDAPDERFSPD